MAYLIPLGACVTLLGLAGLIWCILKVNKARKAGASDEELRAVMQATVPMNLAALFLSAIGLMLVVIGIVFG